MAGRPWETRSRTRTWPFFSESAGRCGDSLAVGRDRRGSSALVTGEAIRRRACDSPWDYLNRLQTGIQFARLSRRHGV